MIFETVATGGCRSYVIGCDGTCAAALIDPELSMKAWREAGYL